MPISQRIDSENNSGAMFILISGARNHSRRVTGTFGVNLFSGRHNQLTLFFNGNNVRHGPYGKASRADGISLGIHEESGKGKCENSVYCATF